MQLYTGQARPRVTGPDTFIKYGGLKVANLATTVGALPVAGTALAVSGGAGMVDRGILMGPDISRRDYKSLGVDAAVLVIPMKANKALNGEKLLLTEERIVLSTVVRVSVSTSSEVANETRKH